MAPLPSRNGSQAPPELRARGGLAPPGPVNERENDSHTHCAYLSLNSAGPGRSSVRRRAKRSCLPAGRHWYPVLGGVLGRSFYSLTQGRLLHWLQKGLKLHH